MPRLLLAVAFVGLATVALFGTRAAALAPDGRYVVDTDTTTDTVTALTWQQTPPEASYDQAAANAYCDGLALGGHEDWRLPSLHELLSIVDPTRGGPTIDSRGFPSTPSAYYWTRTPYAPVSGLGWTVSFSAGTSFPQNESVAARVRCVR
ncbi:MAG: DUF1566 domain-containing protein [Polyangiales bacterium]|nr:DUF1566 domain-containing protein [Myxococcales bacterium]MCB9658708.1 DUF1566 domain-containing protein [Sandaracinaceae bacterium]